MKTKFFIASAVALNACSAVAHLVPVHISITINAIETVAAYSTGYNNFMYAINPNGGVTVCSVDGVGATPQRWMVVGSAREDDVDAENDVGGKRSYNHFYNPVNGQGLSDASFYTSAVFGRSSFVWASVSNCPCVDSR